jgi:hypothetical protein
MLPTSHTVILFSRTGSLLASHFHLFLLVIEYPIHLASSVEVAPYLNWANHSKTYILPTFCFPKATLNISKLPVAFHPQFKAKSVADTLLCQVFHSPGTCKSQVEDMLVLHMTLLNNYMRCMDIQARNDPADSTVSACRHKQFVLAAVLLPALRSVQKLFDCTM